MGCCPGSSGVPQIIMKLGCIPARVYCRFIRGAPFSKAKSVGGRSSYYSMKSCYRYRNRYCLYYYRYRQRYINRYVARWTWNIHSCRCLCVEAFSHSAVLFVVNCLVQQKVVVWSFITVTGALITF